MGGKTHTSDTTMDVIYVNLFPLVSPGANTVSITFNGRARLDEESKVRSIEIGPTFGEISLALFLTLYRSPAV